VSTAAPCALGWVVPLFVLHNAEEALAIRPFLAVHGDAVPTLLGVPSASRFQVALALVTALALLVPPLVRLTAGPLARMAVLLALQAVMLLNVLSHLGIAWWARGYAPGLATAIALELPFSLYLFHRAFWERWVSRRLLAALLPIALFVQGPVLIALMWTVKHLGR
jgi:hypothetical protein